MRFFITGAGGQLGHDVMNEVNQRGHEAVGSGSKPAYSGVQDGSAVCSLPYVQLDIRDRDAVMKTIAAVKPDVVIHCAAWTAVETVDQLAGFDNVWFDMAAVCESPAMFRILQKTGTQRCMWGSDYPISNLAGKAISLGGAFYWINEKDINGFESGTSLQPWLIATENLMAVRQACIMAELGRKDIEDILESEDANSDSCSAVADSTADSGENLEVPVLDEDSESEEFKVETVAVDCKEPEFEDDTVDEVVDEAVDEAAVNNEPVREDTVAGNSDIVAETEGSATASQNISEKPAFPV